MASVCTVRKCAAYIAGLLAAYDFGKFDTIADIEGGNGHLLRAVLESGPLRIVEAIAA